MNQTNDCTDCELLGSAIATAFFHFGSVRSAQLLGASPGAIFFLL